MHRKSAGKKVMIHAVAIGSLQLATEACYVCISQKMQVRDPSAPASGRARSRSPSNERIVDCGGILPKRKAHESGCELTKKHDPKS